MTVVTRSPGVVTAHISGQLVALNDKMEYVALDPMGEAIFELIKQPCSVDQLVESVTARFDIDEPTCRADVSEFLAQLESSRLVNLSSAD
ncbi:MAG: PqqD family protein [Actinomycetes bacterium]